MIHIRSKNELTLLWILRYFCNTNNTVVHEISQECGKTPLLKLKRLKRSGVTEMNRKIRVTIFLVFVLSLSCSLVSAAYVENPPMPDIKVDIESHPQVVEWMIDQPNNDVNFPDNGDVHVVVGEGRAKDVVILERTPWTNMVHGGNLKLEHAANFFGADIIFGEVNQDA